MKVSSLRHYSEVSGELRSKAHHNDYGDDDEDQNQTTEADDEHPDPVWRASSLCNDRSAMSIQCHVGRTAQEEWGSAAEVIVAVLDTAVVIVQHVGAAHDTLRVGAVGRVGALVLALDLGALAVCQARERNALTSHAAASIARVIHSNLIEESERPASNTSHQTADELLLGVAVALLANHLGQSCIELGEICDL